MKNSFLNAMAVGDAFGMRFEFVEHACNLTHADLHYGPHPKFEEYQPAHYTDDTQMSLANAKLIMDGRTLFSDKDFINAWLSAFHRDPRPGYSRYMNQVLTESQSADEFRARLDPLRRTTSGAAMRAGVFGLFYDIKTVKDLTVRQAKITHNTAAGVNAALAIALGVHYLHHGGNREKVKEFVAHHLSDEWNNAINGYTADPGNGPNIAMQVLDVVSRSGSLSQTLLRAANYAPVTDTDTLCALSLQMASRDRDTVDDLPSTLYDSLEDDPRQRNSLRLMDDRLMTTFPPSLRYAASENVPKFTNFVP